jgi:hypothetical protein
MNLQNTLYPFLLLTGISFNLNAAEPLRILDRGLDGDKRYYAITCPGGQTSTVIQQFNIDTSNISEPEFYDSLEASPATIKGSSASAGSLKLVNVCIYPYAGAEECQNKWDLEKAAEASCVESSLPPLTEEQKKVLDRPHLGL